MSTVTFTNVNRYTRAGKNGKQILCPECIEWSTVYHFGWSSLTCIHCEEDVVKEDWITSRKVDTRQSGTRSLDFSLNPCYL